jgi:hypothetical protein
VFQFLWDELLGSDEQQGRGVLWMHLYVEYSTQLVYRVFEKSPLLGGYILVINIGLIQLFNSFPFKPPYLGLVSLMQSCYHYSQPLVARRKLQLQT